MMKNAFYIKVWRHKTNSTSDFEVKVARLSRKDASGNPIK